MTGWVTVAAAERERCAHLAEQHADIWDDAGVPAAANALRQYANRLRDIPAVGPYRPDPPNLSDHVPLPRKETPDA